MGRYVVDKLDKQLSVLGFLFISLWVVVAGASATVVYLLVRVLLKYLAS